MSGAHYRYITDLLALDQCRPVVSRPAAPEGSSSRRAAISSRVPVWQRLLSDHPDRNFVSYIIQGLSEGFRIGFDYTNRECRSARRNAAVIDSYIREERSLARLLVPDDGVTGVQVNPFGVIPKPHQPNKWRLIVDLSSPRGASVNDGIDQTLCSISYVSIDEAARRVVKLGSGALLAKLDLRNAYRVVPVHPDDQPLLGMRWGGSLFLDAALPFGLRSAPKIFSAVADALLWCMYTSGVTSAIHYLDDFLFFGRPDSEDCGRNLAKAVEVCTALGTPVAPHKLEGPLSVLTFLGIEIDTVQGLLRLPEEKLLRLRSVLAEWLTRRSCTKRELLSLIGVLHHAASVVKPGRIFVRRLIDLASTMRVLHFYLRINREARSDILWWASFVDRWNGEGLLSALGRLLPSRSVQTDASGSWGCGAVYGSQWIQLAWPEEWQGQSIAPKEMLPVLAAFTWGKNWSGSYVKFESDNSTVVAALRSGTYRNPIVMHLLRTLHFVAAHFAFTFSASHIAGSINTVADAISRNFTMDHVSAFPQLNFQPTFFPWVAVDLLCDTSMDWTSEVWRTLFLASLTAA